MYNWLDTFCPSWEFEASFGASASRSHEVIRGRNEETLRHLASVQVPDGPAQNKVEFTGIRVATEREAAACKIHYVDCHVEPRGELT